MGKYGREALRKSIHLEDSPTMMSARQAWADQLPQPNVVILGLWIGSCSLGTDHYQARYCRKSRGIELLSDLAIRPIARLYWNWSFQRLNLIISHLLENDLSVSKREFDLWRGMAAGTQAKGLGKTKRETKCS